MWEFDPTTVACTGATLGISSVQVNIVCVCVRMRVFFNIFNFVYLSLEYLYKKYQILRAAGGILEFSLIGG